MNKLLLALIAMSPFYFLRAEYLYVPDYMTCGLGPYVGTSDDPSNPDRSLSIYWDTAACGYPIIQRRSGDKLGPTGTYFPWQSESFFLEGSYIKILAENKWNSITGEYEEKRIFRHPYEDKGIVWAHKWVWNNPNGPNPVNSYNIPYYVEEHWGVPPYDDKGWPTPSCSPTTQVPVNGSATRVETVYIGTLWNEMIDNRVGQNDALRHVDLIKVVGFWGLNRRDVYYYGKIFLDGDWVGIGLYGFETWEDDVCLQNVKRKYIVDMIYNSIPCTTCPD